LRNGLDIAGKVSVEGEGRMAGLPYTRAESNGCNDGRNNDISELESIEARPCEALSRLIAM
jgi:hypothetical protein